MAIISNTYTGDGSTVIYSLSFPYIERSHVKTTINGTPTTAFTFVNATTIQFGTAPANGAVIVLFRDTPFDELDSRFFPNSSIRSDSLNNNFTQGLYVAQETNSLSNQAISTANGAVVTANGAVATANNAVSTANGAVVTANAADAKSDQAIIDSAAAVVTANTAEGNSIAAVNTANSASSAASAAVSTANAASSLATQADANATQALSTANQADADATLALSTANQADSDATQALSTANQALNDAGNAISTANQADSNASAAVITANAAASAVASAVLFVPVADLAALLALTPADGDFYELNDSTGAESEPSIVGLPVGLVGDPGLTFRLTYLDPPGEFVFLSYFANNPEDRYANVVDGATGAGPDKVFLQNDQVVTTSYTIPTGKNASSTGTIEVSVGTDVTVSANSTWVIL